MSVSKGVITHEIYPLTLEYKPVTNYLTNSVAHLSIYLSPSTIPIIYSLYNIPILIIVFPGETCFADQKQYLSLGKQSKKQFLLPEKTNPLIPHICWLHHVISPIRLVSITSDWVPVGAEAKSLNIPLFGNDTQGAFWGTKTGNRQVFLVAGLCWAPRRWRSSDHKMGVLPSGKHTKSYWKLPFISCYIHVVRWFTHEKWWGKHKRS